MDDTNYLAHHGVKGMKWGVRKERPTSGRRFSKAIGALDKTGRVFRSGASRVGKAAGAGIRKVGSAAKAGVSNAVSASKEAQKQKQQEEFTNAIKTGDVNTVKSYIKKGLANEQDVRFVLNKLNAEKQLMTEVSANRKKTGAEKVVDYMNNFGDTRLGRALAKGAASGMESVAETIVKNAASQGAGVAANAAGAGVASALTAFALHKVGDDTSGVDYAKAFRSGVVESLKRSGKQNYGLNVGVVNNKYSDAFNKNSSNGGDNSGTDSGSNASGDNSGTSASTVTKEAAKSASSYWNTPDTKAVVDDALRKLTKH